MKLMWMGGREEILLKRVSAILIILEIMPEKDSHRLNQSISEEDYCI
jgi:hypothetical protein